MKLAADAVTIIVLLTILVVCGCSDPSTTPVTQTEPGHRLEKPQEAR